MICDWIFLSSQLRTFTNCRPFIEIRLPFIFFLFESFLKVVSVAKFFCSWLLIPNNGAGSIQSVMVSCVREIKECTHFSLGENIWSSPLLRFWHLKVEWLCWQLSTEVGRNAWEMRSGFFFLKGRRKWFLAFSCIFTHKFVKSSPRASIGSCSWISTESFPHGGQGFRDLGVDRGDGL